MEASAEKPRRAPDFFIVGHSKCGTTAIYDMLKQHPQLHMPIKEPRYFVPELRSRYWRPAANELKRPHTLDGYLSLFTGAREDQLIGEATPEYLRSFTTPARIAEVQPNARIIAVLREPTSFLRSLHLQAVHNYNETEKDFQKAIELEPERRRGKRIPRFSQTPQALLYSDHVRYAQQLRAYAASFPSENILVLIYDDLRRDNQETVRRVFRFLGVDEMQTVEPVRTPTLPGVRFQLLEQLGRAHSIARHNPRTGPFIRRLERLIPTWLRGERWGRAWRRLVFTDTSEPDERFIAALRTRFKAEVGAVSEHLGRDLLSEWGYDGSEDARVSRESSRSS
jgi:Sulfotransferase family